MNHRQLGLGTATTESTGEPTEMFVFMRSYSTSVSSKKQSPFHPRKETTDLCNIRRGPMLIISI